MIVATVAGHMTGSTTVGWIDQMILIIGTREGCTAVRVRTRIPPVALHGHHGGGGRPDVDLVPDV